MKRAQVGGFYFAFAITSAASVACGGSDHPIGGGHPPEPPIVEAFPEQPAKTNVQWFTSGVPVTIDTALFHTWDVDKAAAKTPACTLTSEQFTGVPDALRSIGSQLTNKTAVTDVSKAAGWISQPNPAPYFAVSFFDHELTVDAGASVSYSPVSVGVNASASNQTLTLIVAQIYQELSLGPKGEECMKAFICATPNKSGRYVKTVYYGTMLRLGIKSGSYNTAIGTKGIPIVNASFSLAVQNLEIQGGFIGNLTGNATTAADIKKLYDVPNVVQDLSAHNMVKVAASLDSQAKQYGIVAVSPMDISSADCGH